MYESYTRQSLPEKEYRALLGSALCVFNLNNSFIIENILRSDDMGMYNWYQLIDLESGQLKPAIRSTISQKCGPEIETLFSEIIDKRNRIIHSFQITYENQQILATKERQKDGSKQFLITETYLIDFIKANELLSSKLHQFRGF